MTKAFCDAETEPSITQAIAARGRNFLACGFYLASSYPNIRPAHGWSVGGVDILKEAQLTPMPIWVPKASLADVPQDSANAAFEACKSYGLWPKDTTLYNGNHIYASGPMWIPGSFVPPTIATQTAYQYAQTTIDGWSIDVDVAADDFNFTNLVVDFEFDTLAGVSGVNWYTIFRQTIQSLAREVPSMGLYLLDPQTAGDPAFIVIDGTYLQYVNGANVPAFRAKGAIDIPADHEMILDALKHVPTPGANT